MGFKVGDIVYLKSGSRKMTISSVYNNRIIANWINFDTGEPHQIDLLDDCFTYKLDKYKNRRKY